MRERQPTRIETQQVCGNQFLDRSLSSFVPWLFWHWPPWHIWDCTLSWITWPVQSRLWLSAVRDQQQRCILTAWVSTISWEMSFVMIELSINMYTERTDLSSVQVTLKIRFNLQGRIKIPFIYSQMTPGTSQRISMVKREKLEVYRKKIFSFHNSAGNSLIKVILIIILIPVKQGWQILRI